MNKVKIPAFPTPVRVDWKHTAEGGVTNMVVGSLNDRQRVLSHLQSCLNMNSWSDSPFTVLLPSVSAREIVYAESRDGQIDVKLTSTAEMDPGLLEIPMLELEYTMDNDGLGIDPRTQSGDPAVAVLNGFAAAIETFENELLFDVLAKAVRSQRNKVKKEISRDAVSEAMRLSESLGFRPEVAVLNTESHSKVRSSIEDARGKLFGMEVFYFPPKRRGNKTRNYFVGDAGASQRTPVRLDFDDEGNMTLSYELGVVVFERNAIACLEEPE